MKKLNLLAVMAASTTLAACGGGSTGVGGGTTLNAADFATLSSDYTAVTPTTAASLPSGSATYNGVAGFNTTNLSNIDPTATDPSDLANNLTGYYGAMRLNVNFAGNNLTGSVDNFQDFSGNRVSGQIGIQAGVVTPVTNATLGDGFTALATGPIDGDSYIFDVTGSFLGDNGEGAAIYFEDQTSDAIGSGFAAR